MAITLYCDPDVLDPGGNGDQLLRAKSILGDESPLEFIEGHALVQDEEAAATLVRKYRPVHYAESHPDGDSGYFDDAEADDGAGDGAGEESEATGADDEPADDEVPDGVQALLDGTWQEAVAAVEAGDADEFLDELEAAEHRDSVLAAIGARRE